MVAAMTTSLVTLEVKDSIAILRMDDGKANALSPAMLDALHGALDRAEKEAKVVALFGRPGRFCAGFDLRVMMSSPAAAQELVTTGTDLYLRLFLHPQPVVAAVTGHALAGGILLAACGDVRIGASGDFKLGLNEIQIGMPVPILAHELARARVESRHLTAATLLATIYTPETAREVGWLDRVVAPEALEAEALAEAARLTAIGGPHFALTKKTLRGETAAYIRRTLDENLRAFASTKQ